MSKRALIFGITGQDGSYLAELLLSKGYEVFGVVRRSATPNYWRLVSFKDKLNLIDGDLLDSVSIAAALEESNPDEVYNLAAMSFVGASWKQPILSAEITGIGVLRILETIRQFNPKIKYYQASSSEMFGKVHETPQKETTLLHPRSPYGVAKVFGHYMVTVYRESYNMFAVSGILFNHESPKRGIEFVTRKITNGVARIKKGLQSELRLGNLDAKRDWGHSLDYVEGMWLMLQQSDPKDYILATGETRSVREFCDIAFKYVGLDYNKYVVVDPKFFRPAEVDLLIGDFSKAKKDLGWEPKISFKELVEDMVQYDLNLLDT